MAKPGGESMSDPKETIAYHEAGHAVISMKLGYKCLYVTIVPDGDRLGHVCCQDPLMAGHADKIRHALEVLIAASLAEAKHFGWSTWGDAGDCAQAKSLALLASDHDAARAEVLLETTLRETRERVEQHWQEIDALAQRLVKNGTVNFLEVEARTSETSQ